MGLSALTLGYIAAGTAAVGTVASIQQNRQSRKESRKAARAQQRIAARENQRAKLQQLRESQITRAQMLASGATGGTLNTSALQGGISSVGSQTAGNISFINQIEGLQQQIIRSQQKAADFSANAGGIQALTNLGVQAASSGTPPPENFKNAGTGLSNWTTATRKWW